MEGFRGDLRLEDLQGSYWGVGLDFGGGRLGVLLTLYEALFFMQGLEKFVCELWLVCKDNISSIQMLHEPDTSIMSIRINMTVEGYQPPLPKLPLLILGRVYPFRVLLPRLADTESTYQCLI